MKKIFYFIFCSFILFVSCDEKKNTRLLTAGKLIRYLDNSNVEAIDSLITIIRTTGRPNKEQITNDCLYYNQLKITDNYRNLKYSYIENENDLAYPFKVIVPLFEGIDTIENRRITKVTLEVNFGPEWVHDGHHIAGYYINTEFNFIKSADTLRRPINNYYPTEDSR